jgi:hypothetical protein
MQYTDAAGRGGYPERVDNRGKAVRVLVILMCESVEV